MNMFKELLNEFLLESFELLEQLDQSLLELEQHPNNNEILNKIFRIVHTIKGSADILKFDTLTKLTHNIENILNKARKGSLKIDDSNIDVIFESIDILKSILYHIKEHKNDNIDIESIIDKLVHIKSSKKVNNSSFMRNPTFDLNNIRVNVDKLDELVNLVGELILTKNSLSSLTKDIENQKNPVFDKLNQINLNLSSITNELQNNVMSVRMVPISQIFKLFSRVVRDISKDLNKKVKFIIKGNNAELDKSIVEKLKVPLLHMIRNAIDHGIETPQERKALGKKEEGSLVIEAYNKANQIIIKISDDGRGIDIDQIRKVAIQKGLISAQIASTLTDKEILMLIFEPGFSTASKITNISGRGVGMDAVKKDIEKLNGTIEVESTLNKGTTFKIRLPLTLAIINVLFVKVKDETFAIPLNNILTTLKLSKTNIFRENGLSYIKLFSEKIPIVDMAKLFKFDSNNKDNLYIVILSNSATKIAFIVDEFINQEEIFIKSLGKYLANIEGIMGSTIKDNGEIVLVLDAVKLLNIAKREYIG